MDVPLSMVTMLPLVRPTLPRRSLFPIPRSLREQILKRSQTDNTQANTAAIIPANHRLPIERKAEA